MITTLASRISATVTDTSTQPPVQVGCGSTLQQSILTSPPITTTAAATALAAVVAPHSAHGLQLAQHPATLGMGGTGSLLLPAYQPGRQQVFGSRPPSFFQQLPASQGLTFGGSVPFPSVSTASSTLHNLFGAQQQGALNGNAPIPPTARQRKNNVCIPATQSSSSGHGLMLGASSAMPQTTGTPASGSRGQKIMYIPRQPGQRGRSNDSGPGMDTPVDITDTTEELASQKVPVNHSRGISGK